MVAAKLRLIIFCRVGTHGEMNKKFYMDLICEVFRRCFLGRVVLADPREGRLAEGSGKDNPGYVSRALGMHPARPRVAFPTRQ